MCSRYSVQTQDHFAYAYICPWQNIILENKNVSLTCNQPIVADRAHVLVCEEVLDEGVAGASGRHNLVVVNSLVFQYMVRRHVISERKRGFNYFSEVFLQCSMRKVTLL